MDNTNEYAFAVERFIDSIKFDKVYSAVLSAVKDGPNIIFNEQVRDKLRPIDLDVDQYNGWRLKDFFKASQSGTVETMKRRYEVRKDFFKIVNIECFEHLSAISQQYEDELSEILKEQNVKGRDILEAVYLFRKKFFNEVFAKRKKHNLPINVKNGKLCYKDLDEYIDSCLNSAILNIQMLRSREKTVYWDYAENKSNKNITI